MFTDISLSKPIIGVFTEFNAIDMFFKSIFNKSDILISEVYSSNPIVSLHKKIGFTIVQHDANLLIMKLTRVDFDMNSAKFRKVLHARLDLE